MKKITLLLVITFTFLFTNTSWGEWKNVIKKDGSKYYYDKDRLRESEKYIYFWLLVDFKTPNESGILSKTSYIEVECLILRMNPLRTNSYKNSMGEGDIKFTETPRNDIGSSGYIWEYPTPDSTFEIILNKICEEHQ